MLTTSHRISTSFGGGMRTLWAPFPRGNAPQGPHARPGYNLPRTDAESDARTVIEAASRRLAPHGAGLADMGTAWEAWPMRHRPGIHPCSAGSSTHVHAGREACDEL